MVSFNLCSASSSTPLSSNLGAATPRPETASSPSAAEQQHPSGDKCPVDHETRSKWLAANSGATPHPFSSSSSEENPGASSSRTVLPDTISISNSRGGSARSIQLSQDRVISSIPRAKQSYPSPEGSVPYPAASNASPQNTTGESSIQTQLQSHSSTALASGEGKEGEEKWVYPSEAQFFQALLRKNHKPQASDMRTIVPIHNAVNEKAWEEVLAWEAGMGGERCGGVRLVSFEGRPKDMTPKAWFKTLVGYTPPFDRHDWLIDRCGTHVRYVIDFYSGKSDPSRPGNMAFYLDVRPAVDSWEGVKTRIGGMWR